MINYDEISGEVTTSEQRTRANIAAAELAVETYHKGDWYIDEDDMLRVINGVARWISSMDMLVRVLEEQAAQERTFT